ncbi:unnamed protein product [Amoebophrya sp. A120]|nr:unnamed protein product [Amoebophrya sp. A120]|eukprot:GSA120T00005984001.1
MRTIFPTHAKSLGQALSTILVGAIKDQVFVVFKIATAELESVPGLSVLLELATPVLHQFSGIIASSLLSYLVTIGGELMLEEVSTEAIAAAQQALAETAESRVAAEQEHSTFLAYLQEKLEKGSNTLFPDSLREELMQALINHCLHKSHELFKPEAKSFLHTGAHGTAGLAMVQLGSADTAAEHVDPHGDADAPRIDDFRRVRFASEKQPTMPLLLLANNMTEPPVSALDLQFSTHDHQKADAGTSHGEKALTVVSWDVVHKMITAFENVGKTISAHVWTELKDSAQHLFENFVGVAVSDAMSEIRAALSAFFRGVASDTLATHLAEHPSGKELAKNKGEHLAAEESIRSAINGCDLTPATESASGTKKAIQKATDGLRSAIETNVIHNTFDNFVKKLLGLLGVGQHTAEGSAGGTHPHQQGLKDLIHTLLESLMGHIETLMGMLHGGHGHKSAAAFLEHNVAGSQSVYVDAFAELSNGREDKKHGRTLPDSVVPGDEFSPAATEPEDLA